MGKTIYNMKQIHDVTDDKPSGDLLKGVELVTKLGRVEVEERKESWKVGRRSNRGVMAVASASVHPRLLVLRRRCR